MKSQEHLYALMKKQKFSAHLCGILTFILSQAQRNRPKQILFSVPLGMKVRANGENNKISSIFSAQKTKGRIVNFGTIDIIDFALKLTRGSLLCVL